MRRRDLGLAKQVPWPCCSSERWNECAHGFSRAFARNTIGRRLSHKGVAVVESYGFGGRRHGRQNDLREASGHEWDFCRGLAGKFARRRHVFPAHFEWRAVVRAGCVYNATAWLLRDGGIAERFAGLVYD